MTIATTLPESAAESNTMPADLEMYSYWREQVNESARNILMFMDRTDALMEDSIMDDKEAEAMRQVRQIPVSSIKGSRLPSMD
jgi:hypothetical protein